MKILWFYGSLVKHLGGGDEKGQPYGCPFVIRAGFKPATF